MLTELGEQMFLREQDQGFLCNCTS